MPSKGRKRRGTRGGKNKSGQNQQGQSSMEKTPDGQYLDDQTSDDLNMEGLNLNDPTSGGQGSSGQGSSGQASSSRTSYAYRHIPSSETSSSQTPDRRPQERRTPSGQRLGSPPGIAFNFRTPNGALWASYIKLHQRKFPYTRKLNVHEQEILQARVAIRIFHQPTARAAMLTQFLRVPAPPGMNLDMWKRQQTKTADHLNEALEDNLSRFKQFLDDEAAFATVCLPKSQTPLRGAGEVGSRGPDVVVRTKDEVDLGFDLHDERGLINADRDAYDDYMKYVDTIADPHRWYMYDPIWLRKFGGIDLLDEQARYEIHDMPVEPLSA